MHAHVLFAASKRGVRVDGQGLNIGGGGGTTKEIKLRVCKPGSEAFIDYDFIVGTMLHELCHNVHGPHDAKFYKLLDTISEVRRHPCYMQHMRPVVLRWKRPICVSLRVLYLHVGTMHKQISVTTGCHLDPQ